MRRLLALLLLLPIAPAVTAAESFDACTGFIDALPATIATQGVWCMRKDVSTNIAEGAAITISTNNVTLDCNGFKLGGLSAGPESLAAGVYANGRLNATVRNCAIRGFHTGVRLVGTGIGGGHLVQDNRIDQSLRVGIRVDGDNNLVQRNRVFDSGAAGSSVSGIQAEADIADNTIDGLVGSDIIGIYAGGHGTEVRHNRIRNVAPTADSANGIITFGAQISIVDNRVINVDTGDGPAMGPAIISAGEGNVFCRDNLVAGYTGGISMCEDNGGNVVH
jgi:hypothetical protein